MHFTYADPSGDPNVDLVQGDIIKRTPEVEAILRAAHPYYDKAEYKFFMLITQSCDLVRRSGSCKTRYLNIAAVRPLDVVLQRYFDANCLREDFDKRAGVCSDKYRSRFVQFVERLLNNNEIEYFYLEQESSSGLSTDMCALLRETIPLRASEHYDTLLNARVLSLEEMFQAKLGWLVGQLYGRVGTDEWIPKAVPTQQAFDALVNVKAGAVCTWIPDRKLKKARKDIDPKLPDEELRKKIELVRIKTVREEVLDRVVVIIQSKIPGAQAAIIRTALGSDTDLKSLLVD